MTEIKELGRQYHFRIPHKIADGEWKILRPRGNTAIERDQLWLRLDSTSESFRLEKGRQRR